MSSRPTVFITVDTEEDNWGDYACRTPSTRNVSSLLNFQAICDEAGALPTYLVNWPVTDDAFSAAVLRDLLSSGRCEIGTHIHPWNTPPVDEVTGPFNSMLSNLPDELIRAKLQRLHAAIEDRLGATPSSFRAGRWGFNASVAQVLHELGYMVDTSVSPFMDWRHEHGPDYRVAPTDCYRFHPARPLERAQRGPMFEVPATIGFLGGRSATRLKIREWASAPVPRRLRMVGVVDRLRIAALRWLSPEVTNTRDLIALARAVIRSGATHLNFTFHSTTLEAGLTPFVRTADERIAFERRIRNFLEFARSEGYAFQPLSAAPHALGRP